MSSPGVVASRLELSPDRLDNTGLPTPGHDSVNTASVAAGAANPTQVLTDAQTEVSKLIAQEKTKAAVELAKRFHKDLGSPESELLLAETYAARIRGMVAKGMGNEAQALLDLARKRHPAAAAAFDGLAQDLAARTGSFDELLRPLANPDLPPAERRAIEDVVKHRATDLQAIAACEALPQDHDLRRAARAAWLAFQAVTSGPVEEDAVALPEISRRSPLAPWKTLIRALACFYRREDDLCRKYLDAIETKTPPARIAFVLGAMLENAPPPKQHPEVQRLMSAVSKDLGVLRGHLEKVDRLADENIYSTNIQSQLLKAAHSAVKASLQLDARNAQRIQRRLWVTLFGLDCPVEGLDKLFAKPVPRDSAFWSLMAKFYMFESEFRDENPIAACAAWDEFVCHAHHEGVFDAKSPEAAHIYRIMLKLNEDTPEEIREELEEEFFEEYPSHKDLYHSQPKHIRDHASPFRIDRPETAYFFHPGQLHARIVSADPSPRSYRDWYRWSQQKATAKQAEEVALAWRDAHPKDAEPLLLLMEEAEKRKAYKKALNYLAQAEAVNALDPQVRRAHFRLHLGAFARHFEQNKPHLAAKDLDAIEALPPLDGQDRRAVEAALRAALSTQEGDNQAAQRIQEAAAEKLGDTLTAEVLCWGVASHFGVPENNLPPLTNPSARLVKGARAAAMARATALAKEVGLSLPRPETWDKKLQLDFRDHGQNIEPAHLQAFAEVQLESTCQQEVEMAFQATRAGLLQEGPHLARFMLLRARAVPPYYPWRKIQCLSAAAELARGQRQFDELDEAIDTFNADRALSFMVHRDSKLEISTEHLQHTIAFERKQKKLLSFYGSGRPKEEKCYYPKCKCDDCREGRRPFHRNSVPVGFNPFGWDDEPDDFGGPPDVQDFMGGWDPFGGELPKELETELDALADQLANRHCSPMEMEQKLMQCLLKYVKNHPELFADGDDEDTPGPGKQGDLFDIPF